MAKEQKIIAYKGFDQDLKCRDYQYEIGKEYEMDGNIECCERGFHACESPLEVLDHYFFLSNGRIARFCEVEQSGSIDRENGTTKIASSRIKIKAELKFGDLIKAGVEWLKEKTSPANIKADKGLNDNGGDYAKIGSSGNYAQIGSSGDSAKIGSSGNYAQIGSSGDSAKIGSSGNYAKIGSSGDSAKIDSTGDDSVICCAGHNSAVKAKKGSWITLAEWKYSEEKERHIPVCVKTEYVDGERIKADTWYKLVNGEFKELVE